jgi:hypothetical protein
MQALSVGTQQLRADSSLCGLEIGKNLHFVVLPLVTEDTSWCACAAASDECGRSEKQTCACVLFVTHGQGWFEESVCVHDRCKHASLVRIWP